MHAKLHICYLLFCDACIVYSAQFLQKATGKGAPPINPPLRAQVVHVFNSDWRLSPVDHTQPPVLIMIMSLQRRMQQIHTNLF